MSSAQEDELIRDQVRMLQQMLRGREWTQANAVGELIDPGGKVWFTATYTHGEYTLETSYRPRGAGVAEGVTRVRVTPAVIQAHPRLARELAQDLAQFAEEIQSGDRKDFKAWPPDLWKTLAR